MKKLPTKPEAHIKNSNGFRRLLNFFSEEWILREISPDYGIDYEIEPWKNSKPVNKVSRIQLKNNDGLSENHTPINVLQLKVSTINYLENYENTFIVSLTRDNIFTFKVDAIKKVFNINEDSDTCSIPFVYKRNFLSYQYESWINNPNYRVIFSLLGKKYALDELADNRNRDDFENYYLINVEGNSESDFFEREELANFGYYYSTLKRGQNQAINKLLANLAIASPLQKRGIIEGLAYLNFKNEVTEKIALEFIQSNNSQDILVGLMHLSIPGDNTHLNVFLDAIFNHFNNRRCIYMDDETHGIELISIEALYNIASNESLLLIIEMFYSTAFKPTEMHFIYNLLKNCDLKIKLKFLDSVNKYKNTNISLKDFDKTIDQDFVIRPGF